MEKVEYSKIDKKVKRKWVAALRSRKYRQTTEFLKDGKGYCCLGVLQSLYPNLEQYADVEILEPASTAKFCGLSESAQDFLTMLNDGEEERGIKPHKFYQIARWIERNL